MNSLGMRRRGRFSDEFRAVVLDALRVHPVGFVCENYGISDLTARAWAKMAGITTQRVRAPAGFRSPPKPTAKEVELRRAEAEGIDLEHRSDLCLVSEHLEKLRALRQGLSVEFGMQSRTLKRNGILVEWVHKPKLTPYGEALLREVLGE